MCWPGVCWPRWSWLRVEVQLMSMARCTARARTTTAPNLKCLSLFDNTSLSCEQTPSSIKHPPSHDTHGRARTISKDPHPSLHVVRISTFFSLISGPGFDAEPLQPPQLIKSWKRQRQLRHHTVWSKERPLLPFCVPCGLAGCRGPVS